MGRRIGIVAGSGAFPLLAIEEARRQGYGCVIAGIRGEASPDIGPLADAFEWIGAAEPARLAAFFQGHDIREVLLVGKVEHRAIFALGAGKGSAAELLAGLPDRTPTSLLRALIGYLSGHGIEVKDPSFLIAPHVCSAGVLSKRPPSAAVEVDIAFAWPIAKRLADLDVGQSLVVKDRAVVAVEGMEGTDETVLRSGRLAGPGTTLVKVARTRQDPRIDIPAAGLGTVRTLIRVRAAALCFEAGQVAFFQKEEALALADANGIAVIARN